MQVPLDRFIRRAARGEKKSHQSLLPRRPRGKHQVLQLLCRKALRLFAPLDNADLALRKRFFGLDDRHASDAAQELFRHKTDPEVRLDHREDLICRRRLDIRLITQAAIGEQARIPLKGICLFTERNQRIP